eukprot:COSAG05_NODE_439_length_9821_cov_110.691556_4_plen_56_part_00
MKVTQFIKAAERDETLERAEWQVGACSIDHDACFTSSVGGHHASGLPRRFSYQAQ